MSATCSPAPKKYGSEKKERTGMAELGSMDPAGDPEEREILFVSVIRKTVIKRKLLSHRKCLPTKASVIHISTRAQESSYISVLSMITVFLRVVRAEAA